MANTIPTAVSSLGDAFECMLLDSSRVSTLSVDSDATDTVFDLSEITTLITVYTSAQVELVRGDAWSDDHAWPMVAGYHPFNVPSGSRVLRFRLPAGVTDAAAVKVMEN